MKNNFSLIEVFNAPELDFKGNTAAVIYLPSAISDKSMQQIAADLNQPATTFLWKINHDEHTFNVRWFAPDGEIGLCGHGSMAAMAWLEENLSLKELKLKYRQGEINCNILNNGRGTIAIDEILITKELEVPKALEEALGRKVLNYFETDNKHIVLLENEDAVRNMKPDFSALRQIKTFGYSVTAPGSSIDFVSRTLVPHVQQLEDPATGSSHAALVPFWAKRLDKNTLTAHQLSKRGGLFYCSLQDHVVKLEGNYTILANGQFIL